MTPTAIRLTKDELRDPLPLICMITGEDTEETVEQKFSFTPGWVYVLLIINWLICLIVALVVTKKMTITVPVVDDQRTYWKRRSWITAWFVISAIVSLVGGGAVAIGVSSDNEPLAIAMGVFGFITFIALLVGASVFVKSGVHVVEITETSIKFKNAHPRFVEAVIEERELREEEDRAWRARRKAKREAEAPPPINADAEERDDYYRKKHRDD
jgi:hypothetical protein